MHPNDENLNKAYCVDECSDHIKKIVNKSDELMEITRDEVFKYQKELKEKERYRTKITELVEKIEKPEYLFKIYHYILAKYRREQEEKGTED